MAQALTSVFDWSALAKAHPILAKVPDSLRATAACRELAKDEVVFRRGSRPKFMLFVLDGELRLIRNTIAGGQVVLQRSHAGFIAEASMESKAYHCDIVAADEGRLLMFPILAFRQALEVDVEFRGVWMSRLAGEVRRLRAQNERLHLNKAVDRILHYLESEGRDGAVTLTQSRKVWATELGLSHEALYRTLAKMENEGLISLSGDQIKRISLKCS